MKMPIAVNPKKIYLASSWKNKRQPYFVAKLRSLNHEVYDFRHPADGTGFAWSQIDPHWGAWTSVEYLRALDHPISQAGFKSDFDAMAWADTCVLLLPSGRSAHSEAGWMRGKNKNVYVLFPSGEPPELMYLMYNKVCTTDEELFEALK